MVMDAHFAHPDESMLKELFGVNSTAIMAAYTAESRHKAPEDAWLEVLTDYQFKIAAVRLAEEYARRGVPVWMYRFDWSAGPLGAFHSLELPFVWQNLGNAELLKVFQVSFSAKDQLLARRMHAAWIAFLRTGNPNVPALPSWPRYTNAQRATMLFDTACHVAQMLPVQEAPGFQVWGFSEDER